MRSLVLFGTIFSMSLRRSLAHRTNLVFEGLVSVTNVAAGLLVLAVIFGQTETLAGWTQADVVVLLGTYHIASGILWTFIEPNVAWFRNQVIDGKLDDTLLKPVSSLFMTSLGSCAPWGLFQVVVGLVVVGVGSQIGAQSPELDQWASWVLLMMVAVVMIWSSRVFLACLALWVPGFQPEVLYQAAWQFGRYPVGIYPAAIRSVLTWVIPIAFITSLPAQALTRGVSFWWIGGGLAVAAGSIVLVNLVWNAGLRRYTSATS